MCVFPRAAKIIKMAASIFVDIGWFKKLKRNKNAQLPNTVIPIRGAAHLGLAMDNLESDWDFEPATLALVLTHGYFALRVCAVG